MATILRSAPLPILPFVEEAIAALGYFKPEHAGDLAETLERLWPSGVSADMLARSPVDSMLTAKGMADPGHARRMTTLRITCSLRRAEFDAKRGQWSDHSCRVRLWARREFVCQLMQGHDQALFDWNARPILPQPGCDREYCTCRFTAEFE